MSDRWLGYSLLDTSLAWCNNNDTNNTINNTNATTNNNNNNCRSGGSQKRATRCSRSYSCTLSVAARVRGLAHTLSDNSATSACVRAYVRACLRACVRDCACLWVRTLLHNATNQ